MQCGQSVPTDNSIWNAEEILLLHRTRRSLTAIEEVCQRELLCLAESEAVHRFLGKDFSRLHILIKDNSDDEELKPFFANLNRLNYSLLTYGVFAETSLKILKDKCQDVETHLFQENFKVLDKSSYQILKNFVSKLILFFEKHKEKFTPALALSFFGMTFDLENPLNKEVANFLNKFQGLFQQVEIEYLEHHLNKLEIHQKYYSSVESEMDLICRQVLTNLKNPSTPPHILSISDRIRAIEETAKINQEFRNLFDSANGFKEMYQVAIEVNALRDTILSCELRLFSLHLGSLGSHALSCEWKKQALLLLESYTESHRETTLEA